MHRVINTHVEAIKIGRQIAEQALDSHRKTESSGELHSKLLYDICDLYMEVENNQINCTPPHLFMRAHICDCKPQHVNDKGLRFAIKSHTIVLQQSIIVLSWFI